MTFLNKQRGCLIGLAVGDALGAAVEFKPPDLVGPYEEGFEEWENTGGTIHCTRKRISLEQDVLGQKRKIVRCATHKVAIIKPRDLENWGVNPELYSSYLGSLESAPKVCDHARTNTMWITYAKT